MKALNTLLLCMCGTLCLAQVNPQKAMEDLQQLVGDWRTDVKKDKYNAEVWQPDSAGYGGTGVKVKNEKTVFEEFLRLRIKDGTLYYGVRIPKQNKGEWVDFAMTEHSANSWLFENPAHDFPKKLRYELIDENTLHIKVSGKDGGFEQEMKRMK